MEPHILPLFEIPELPEYHGLPESVGTSNIRHFITHVLPCVRETVLFLESMADNFDHWVEEHRGDTDRLLFIEQVNEWYRELAPWMSMVAAVDRCADLPASESCIYHGGTRERCVIAPPVEGASNIDAFRFLREICIMHYNKKKLAGDGHSNCIEPYRIYSQDVDEITDVLVDSGWLFALLVGYKRQSNGTFEKNNKGQHVLMWDYDKQRFVDAFSSKFEFDILRRALDKIMVGTMNNRQRARLERLVVRRLTQKYGDRLHVIDSLPPNLKHLQQRVNAVRVFKP